MSELRPGNPGISRGVSDLHELRSVEMRLEQSFIELKGLRFHACHGVMHQERLTGGDFLVDVRVKYDISRAMETDEFSDTINYATLYELVKGEMLVPSKLLEHVAGRVGKRLLDELPLVEHVWLKVTKRNPPMGADLEGASVEICMSR